MYLIELIQFLEARDPNLVVPIGFHHPHSHRGDYAQLAFEPKRDVTVGSMLACAKEALNQTYEGYKGGSYTMGEYSDVCLAEYGQSGEEIGPILLTYMVGESTKPLCVTCKLPMSNLRGQYVMVYMDAQPLEVCEKCRNILSAAGWKEVARAKSIC